MGPRRRLLPPVPRFRAGTGFGCSASKPGRSRFRLLRLETGPEPRTRGSGRGSRRLEKPQLMGLGRRLSSGRGSGLRLETAKPARAQGAGRAPPQGRSGGNHGMALWASPTGTASAACPGHASPRPGVRPERRPRRGRARVASIVLSGRRGRGRTGPGR